MKEELLRMLETCINNGSDTDLQALTYILEGMQKKITENKHSFIDQLLSMDRKLDKNSCEIMVPITPIVNNSLGIVHGGVTATILDTAMGTLANYLLPEGFRAVTNQLNIHYIAPGIGDFLRCRAEIVHQGTKTMVISGAAYRSDGRQMAYATGTFFVIQKINN